MAYRKIDPRLWDDERFVELTPIDKLVWLYLLTGPHTTSLPGLWIVGSGELVDGLRLPGRSIQASLEKLEAMGRLVLNPRLRLIRIPNAPRYNRPDNARVVKSWFKLWSDIPECQQKYDHLESVRAAVYAPGADEGEEGGDGQAARGQALIAAWKAWFGSVRAPDKYLTPTLRRVLQVREPEPIPPGSVQGDEAKSSRTIRSDAPNSSTASALVSDPASDLEPEIQTPPETARAPASAPAPAMGLEAAAILAKLRAHPCLHTVADRSTAEALAAQVVAGRATLPQAEVAIDDAGFKYAAQRDKPGGAKTPTELSSFLAGCVSSGASRGKGGGRQATVPFRGPQPQPGAFQILNKNPDPVSAEERERPLV